MTPSLDLSFLRSRTALKRIAAVTAAFTVVGLIYGLVAPKWYRSVLTVVPARSQKGGLSSILGGDLGGLAAGFDAGGGADVPRIAAVLQSVSVADAVIEKFDLRTRYGEKYQENARETLWEHCSVKAVPKPGLVELSCEDKDPRFVQALLTYFADYGNRVFRRVNVSAASEEARFLEKRVAELRQQADDVATRMRQFQEEHKIIDLDTQAKAVVSAMAALNTQRIGKQLELEYARTFSAGDEATTQQLRSQLAVMGGRLRDLEEPPAEATAVQSRAGRSGERGLFPAAMSVPKLRSEFETLYRDRKVAEATLVFALERLEGAKANEARDVSTFQVLDPPALPTRKYRPKRLSVLALFAIAGFAASMAFEWSRTQQGRTMLRRASSSGGTSADPAA
jgi:capsule polysaccharide export protein KpsE/RkpR